LTAFAKHASESLKKESVVYVSGNDVFTQVVKAFAESNKDSKGVEVKNPVEDKEAEFFYDGANKLAVKDTKLKAKNVIKPCNDKSLSTNWADFVASYKANSKLWDTLTVKTVDT